MTASQAIQKLNIMAPDAQVLVLIGGRYVRVDDIVGAHSAPDTGRIYPATSACMSGDELFTTAQTEEALRVALDSYRREVASEG